MGNSEKLMGNLKYIINSNKNEKRNMDRQGFIVFNTRLSPENSRKATSYAVTIRIKPPSLREDKTGLYRSSVLQLYGSNAAIWFSSMPGLILSKAAYSGDIRSPIPMISVHSVDDLLYRRQS